MPGLFWLPKARGFRLWPPGLQLKLPLWLLLCKLYKLINNSAQNSRIWCNKCRSFWSFYKVISNLGNRKIFEVPQPAYLFILDLDSIFWLISFLGLLSKKNKRYCQCYFFANSLKTGKVRPSILSELLKFPY